MLRLEISCQYISSMNFARIDLTDEFRVTAYARVCVTARRKHKRIGDVIRDILYHTYTGIQRNATWYGFIDTVGSGYMIVQIPDELPARASACNDLILRYIYRRNSRQPKDSCMPAVCNR